VRHCIAVESVAVEIANEIDHPVDVELVSVGAILHDIGRGYTHSIAHGIVGSCVARRFGFPEEVCLIIERHIGGGIDSEEA